MKSFKQVAEDVVPKFQRATKTDVHYTGQINGKTYVVPHAFHGNHDVLHGTKVTPIRHSIVVSPTHVQHNNPSLSPEEVARVHSHIKDIHGGQDPKRLGNLDESWLPMRGPKASKETPEVNAEHAKWEKDHAPATRKELKAARGMRTGAADRFLRRYGKTNEERQLALHLGLRKTDSEKPKLAPVVKPKRATSPISKTENPEAYQAERDKYRHAALANSRKAATLAFAKKHHIIKETDMLKEGRPIRGDVFSHHQTLIAKKTLRMPDAMVGVMGWPNKEASRAILRKMGWTEKQIHQHEHAQFVEEVDMLGEHSGTEKRLNPDGSYKVGLKVTVDGKPGEINHIQHSADHPKYPHAYKVTDTSAHDPYRQTRLRGNTFISHHDIKPTNKMAKFSDPGLADQFSGRHDQGTHHANSPVRKKLEERALSAPESEKKEEIVHGMKKKIQGFKERYGTRAKEVMYATATKQGKRLAENTEQLDESFMGTYTRNENANRHTANIVHLAKHFGDAADQAQAKFYASELKKHGHNIHHEAQYKLHEKLWPKAVAAHHQGVVKLEEMELQGIKVASKKGQQSLPLEESKRLDELKVPKVPFMQKHLLGANLRDVVDRVHDMPHHELKSLHHSYEKNPPQSVVQAQQHRSIKKALRKYGDPSGTHTPVDKSKFVKKNLEEHSDTFNTVKRVLSKE